MILAQLSQTSSSSFNGSTAVIGLVAGALLFGPLCAYLMNQKGRSAVGGYFLGFLLGCIGLVITALWPAAGRSSRGSGSATYTSSVNLPPYGGYPQSGGYPQAGGYPPTGGYPPAGGFPPAGGGYPPSGPAVQPAAWYPDPTGRASRRYWDGTAWTENVIDDNTGEQRTDPV